MDGTKCNDCPHENPTSFDCFDCPPPEVREKQKQVPSALISLLCGALEKCGTVEGEKIKNVILLDSLVSGIRANLEIMPDCDRMELVEKIMAGYCSKCGSSNLPCYCWNDE